MLTQLSSARYHDGLYADENTTIKCSKLRMPLCRCKQNCHAPPSRRSLCRWKHNYHTITDHYGLYAYVNTTIIHQSSRRPLNSCKHNNHTIMDNDGLYADVSTTVIRPSSRRPLFSCKYNYHPTVVTMASIYQRRL
jgi:hypothetical protein